MSMSQVVRAALAELWTDRCTVTVQKKRKNGETKRTEQEDSVLFRDVPCRLSFDRVAASHGAGGVGRVDQGVTLFLPSELSVPAGSKITVVRNGTERHYRQSGVSAMYGSHQEIPLVLTEEYA